MNKRARFACAPNERAQEAEQNNYRRFSAGQLEPTCGGHNNKQATRPFDPRRDVRSDRCVACERRI